MKLFLAIVVILMLLSLSTGVETSDNHASQSATALRDRLLGPKATTCQGTSGVCSHHNDCCWWLCCNRQIGGCVVSTERCKSRATGRSSGMLVHPHLQQPADRSN
nr:conotoxin precursor I3 [Conus ebraeus]